MIEIINNTFFPCGLYPGYNREQRHQLTLVFKATFQFNVSGKMELSKEQLPIEEIDRYFGIPGKSSLIAANEVMPYKDGGEVVVYGTAYPNGNINTSSTVEIKTSQKKNTHLHKKLTIFGEREWRRTIFGKRPSKPQRLESLPLRYEYALKSPQNPAGILLPQIEQEPKFMTKPTTRLPTAGFGPIPPAWLGYDTYNYAPTDQQFVKHFQGGELISVTGMTRHHLNITIAVPKLKPSFELELNQTKGDLISNFDTIVINMNKSLLTMVRRAAIPWDINDQRIGMIFIA